MPCSESVNVTATYVFKTLNVESPSYDTTTGDTTVCRACIFETNKPWCDCSKRFSYRREYLNEVRLKLSCKGHSFQFKSVNFNCLKHAIESYLERGGNPNALVTYRYFSKRTLYDWLFLGRKFNRHQNRVSLCDDTFFPSIGRCLPPSKENKTHLICLCIITLEMTSSARYDNVKLLLQKGASWDVLHENKIAPLSLALKTESFGRGAHLSDLLLQNGAQYRVDDMADFPEWNVNDLFGIVRKAALQGFFGSLPTCTAMNSGESAGWS